MSRSMRIFIAGVSLVLVLVGLLGCVPNKQGGFSCAAAPLMSKDTVDAPWRRKSRTTTRDGSRITNPGIRRAYKAASARTHR